MSLDIVIGMDIGGTYTKYGFVDRSGNSYMEGSVDTAGHPDIDSYLENLFSSINASLKKADQEFNIKGIGVIGSTVDSKPTDQGSIPWRPAN